MFKEAGVNPPAGMFSWGHLILLTFFGVLAMGFYHFSRSWTRKKTVHFFKIFSLVLFALEIFKIVWNVSTYGINIIALNRFIPLYYCSIFLYAFILLSWGRGKIAHASLVWMTYGGLIAGVAFLLYPSSSLLEYPFFHFLSIHSIFFHMSLVLISLMILRGNFYEPNKKDFMPFVYFSLLFMGLAFIINKLVGTNLMFLGTPIAIAPFIWLNNQSPVLFEFVMFYAQLFLPFLFSHWTFLFLTRYTAIKIYKNTTETSYKS